MVKIEFATDSAPFADEGFSNEVKRILEFIADCAALGETFNDDPITDVNDNKIGTITIAH